MGQKVNPISVRLEQSNRHFDSCWYADYQYSNLLTQDLKVKSYINNILKQMGCPETHISMIYMAKKIKILFCYLDPRHSTYKKSSRLYIKVGNKNNKKIKKKKIKRNFFKSQFVGRYLCRKIKKIVSAQSEAEKLASLKYNSTIPSVMKKTGRLGLPSKQSQGAIGNFINKNSLNHHIGGNVKIYTQKQHNKLIPNESLSENGGKLGLTKKASMSVTNNRNGNIGYYKKNKSKAEQIIDQPVSLQSESFNGKHINPNEQRKGAFSLIKQTSRSSSGDGFSLASLGIARSPRLPRFASEASERSMKYKRKGLQLNNAIFPNQPVPYSPLVTRRNPFRILLAFYRKKKKKKKYSTKKRFSASFSVDSRRGWKSGKRWLSLHDKRALKKKREILQKKVGCREARQAAFWRYLTNVSVSSMDGKKNKNYDAFSAIWGYLFFNHKGFFHKVIQRKKGFQIWHKSLFIRYLLLFIYKKRFTFLASPINYYMVSQICRLGMQPVNQPNPSSSIGKSSFLSNVKKIKKKNTKNLYIQGSKPFINSQSLRKISLNVDTDRIRLAKKKVNSGLVKYHMALESINRIEWFQGRGMAFLWLIFNSVHPSHRFGREASDQKVIKTASVIGKSGGKSFLLHLPQSRQDFQSSLAASRKRKDNLKLYTYPYRMTQSQMMVLNKLENLPLSNSNKIEQGEKRTATFPVSILTGNRKSFNLSAGAASQATPSSKKKSIAKKTEKSLWHRSPSEQSVCFRKNKTLASSKAEKKKSAKRKTFNHPALLSKKGNQKLRFNRKKKDNYLENEKTDKIFSMARKPLYPRTAKSKGFISYIEYILSSQLKSNVRLFSWKTRDEKKSALFIVEQIVYFLEKRVPFSRIKQQMSRELNLESMKGIRVTYSGRLGGRSKKAQRSRQKTFQWGQTSSHVFKSKLSFASKHALTIFGKIGLKVWVCYR